MKKVNKLGYIAIGIIIALIMSIATPAFAATKTTPVITLAKTIAAKTTENKAVKSTLTAKNSRGYTVTFTVSAKAAHGSVSLSKATAKGKGAAATYTITASYTPAKNYVGNDSYTVSAKDGKGGTATCKVTVNVSASAVKPKPTPAPTQTPITSTPAPTSDTTTTSDSQDINKITTTTDANGGKHDSMTNYQFVLDKDAIGQWDAIDFVLTPDDFDGKDTTRKSYVQTSIYNFYDNGNLASYAVKGDGAKISTWSKGYILDTDNTIPAYTIKQINGKTFMFVEWKSGDYTDRGMTPAYEVFMKTSDTPDPAFANKPILDKANMSFKIDGVTVYLPQAVNDANATLTTTTDADGNRHDKLDYTFTLDKDAVGEWQFFNVYGADEIASAFDPTLAPQSMLQQWTGNSIYADGSMVERIGDNGKHLAQAGMHWTKGYFADPVNICGIPAYSITTVGGKTFMFVEWKSGDYTRSGAISNYYVFVKTSDTPAPAATATK